MTGIKCTLRNTCRDSHGWCVWCKRFRQTLIHTALTPFCRCIAAHSIRIKHVLHSTHSSAPYTPQTHTHTALTPNSRVRSSSLHGRQITHACCITYLYAHYTLHITHHRHSPPSPECTAVRTEPLHPSSVLHACRQVQPHFWWPVCVCMCVCVCVCVCMCVCVCVCVCVCACVNASEYFRCYWKPVWKTDTFWYKGTTITAFSYLKLAYLMSIR